MADLREKLARLICEAIGDDWHREAEDGLIEAYGPVADQIIAALPELLVTEETAYRALCEFCGVRAANYMRRRYPEDVELMKRALTAALTEPGDR